MLLLMISWSINFVDAVDITLIPTKDTWLQSTLPTVNHANNWILSVGADQGAVYRALVAFNISIIPPESIIDSAILSLFYYSGDGSIIECRVHLISQSWIETEPTWNNFNSNYFQNPVISDGNCNMVGWNTWNVTSMVQSWVSGFVQNNGFLVKHLTETGVNNANYASKDYFGGSIFYPRLFIS